MTSLRSGVGALALFLLGGANPDTDGDGEPDESELAPTGRTYWEEQEAWAASTGGGGGSGGGRCGLLGIEAFLR
jgi:hypothetical protein